MEQTAFASLEEQQADEMRDKYLTFFTDAQLFGVPIADVVQIVGVQKIVPVPEFPPYAIGVINLRGSIIPVVDMRLRLGRAQAEYDERTCIIVTSIRDKFVGIIVDAVDAVETIALDMISEPPRMTSNGSYLTGVARLEDTIALLMDLHKILRSDELESLTESLPG